MGMFLVFQNADFYRNCIVFQETSYENSPMLMHTHNMHKTQNTHNTHAHEERVAGHPAVCIVILLRKSDRVAVTPDPCSL